MKHLAIRLCNLFNLKFKHFSCSLGDRNLTQNRNIFKTYNS